MYLKVSANIFIESLRLIRGNDIRQQKWLLLAIIQRLYEELMKISHG
jgi:hypothetical protein